MYTFSILIHSVQTKWQGLHNWWSWSLTMLPEVWDLFAVTNFLHWNRTPANELTRMSEACVRYYYWVHNVCNVLLRQSWKMFNFLKKEGDPKESTGAALWKAWNKDQRVKVEPNHCSRLQHQHVGRGEIPLLPLCICAVYQSICALLQMLLIQSTTPECQYTLYSGVGLSAKGLALFQAFLNLSSVNFFFPFVCCGWRLSLAPLSSLGPFPEEIWDTVGSPLALAKGRDAAMVGWIFEKLSRLELRFWQLRTDTCARSRMCPFLL